MNTTNNGSHSSTYNSNRYLEIVLQEAHLISEAQMEVARQDQQQFSHLDLEEILLLRGWIKANTINFFIHQWPQELKQKIKQPLGYYLEKAGLLTDKQIQAILDEQQQAKTWLRFGELAVFQGWLKAETIDFFLKNLFSQTAKFTTISLGDSCEIVKRYIRGEVDFEGSNLNRMKLRGAILKRINLKSSEIVDADLKKINLSNAILAHANFTHSDLEQAHLQGADLSYSCFQGANLQQAHLNEANLNAADLRGVNLYKAYLNKARLSGANLTKAILEGASLYGAIYDCQTIFPQGFNPVTAGMVFIEETSCNS